MPSAGVTAALLWLLSGQVPPEAQQFELIRDRWGIPHVFAASDEAAWFGLGYAMAQDRAFQMYLAVRTIEGRLAEVVGEIPRMGRRETTVDHDVRMRHFGFARAADRLARRLDGEVRRSLEAFAAGVNHWIQRHPDKRGPMFERYDLVPEPWTVRHSILAWWFVAQFFGPDGTRDLVASRARNRRPSQPAVDDDVAVVRKADVPEQWICELHEFAAQHGITAPATGPADRGRRFSHAWVVGRGRLIGGSAVLVSDPQTLVGNPSLFYECHVVGKTFNARGITVPGSPVFLIGFTQHVAWGLTALGADQADLFHLKTSPDRPGEYQVDGRWHQMEVVPETVHVRDGTPRRFTVQWTRYGPVITRYVFARPGDGEYAVKRVPIALEDRHTFAATLGMLRARSAAEFAQALADWAFPSANCVFADRDGNIGYWAIGAFPLRARASGGSGRFPHDGSRSEHDWQGWIPHRLKPHVLNPASGVLFSANHRPVSSFYPLYLGSSTGSSGETLRSWRLRELLTGDRPLTAEEVLQVHYDCVNPAKRVLAAAAGHVLRRAPQRLSGAARRAAEILSDWHDKGSSMRLVTRGAVLAQSVDLFFRASATPLAERWGGGQSGLARWLKDLQRRLRRAEAQEALVLDRDELDFLDRTLDRAWTTTTARYGEDPSKWLDRYRSTWQRRRLGRFVHLTRFPSLEPENDLPMPWLECVDGSTIWSQAAQTYTQFVILSDPDRSMSILPPGQSEQTTSSYFRSTYGLWSAGRLHPAPLSRAAVERIAAERVDVLP